MKAQLFACVLLLVAIFALTVSQGISSSTDDNGFGNAVTPFLNGSKKNSKRSPQCRRNVQRSCTSSTMSCGRLGRANICQAFQNDCQRQLANCGGNKATKFYRKVNQNLCKGMQPDQALPCGSGGKKRDNGTTPIIKF